MNGKKYDKKALREVAEKNQEFILENQGLIFEFSAGFANRGIAVPLEDMWQIGNIAMLKAIRDFRKDYYKEGKGAKFSVYFRSKFRADLMVEYKTNYYSGICHPPMHYWDGISRITRYVEKQREKHKRDPDVSEISRAIGMSKKRVESYLQTLTPMTISLSKSVGEDGDATLEDFLPDRIPYNQEDLFFLREWAEKFISKLKKKLPAKGKTRAIIIRRIGFIDCGNSKKVKTSLENVANLFGISRERVRQIEYRFAYQAHYGMDLENLYGVKKEKVCRWIRDVVFLIRELDAKYGWGINFDLT